MNIQGINISDKKIERSIMTGLLRSAAARYSLEFVMLLDVAEKRHLLTGDGRIMFMSGVIGKMIYRAPKCYNTLEGSIIIYAAWRFVNFDSEFVERLSSIPGIAFNAETIKMAIKRAKRANADPNDLARATAGLVALEIAS